MLPPVLGGQHARARDRAFAGYGHPRRPDDVDGSHHIAVALAVPAIRPTEIVKGTASMQHAEVEVTEASNPCHTRQDIGGSNLVTPTDPGKAMCHYPEHKSF